LARPVYIITSEGCFTRRNVYN